MAVFKCKMCGGALEIQNNETVATCEYCGTKQTLPRLDDEKRVQLYDRANHFRRENEYDKAMGVYEMILSDDREDCESYWGILLCRYGIEYVEDPRTHRRIPTVNRVQFTSVLEDEDYKNALRYADTLQREVYEQEAHSIDKIQQGILAVSQKEEPFDIFICYKESDHLGNRTQDSVYAQDIYNALIKEGYKVFFSRITLENKLGSAYEPYIFAALNSAKVMLVVGTRKEYFDAVWVKNEWSRYLALIKAGKEKTLIPVYKDISPYEMPEEFQYLQAQDMGKIGFMQDLLHGVGKLVGSKTPVVKESIITGDNANTAPLLKRALMFLEDGDWDSADEYCEKVLDIDPECAEAYLGKLMVELHIKTRQMLANDQKPFDQSINCQKALRFANDELRAELTQYIDQNREKYEIAQKEERYNQAKTQMLSAATESALKDVAQQFLSLENFKDSAALAERCMERATTVHKNLIRDEAIRKMKKNTIENYKNAIELFDKILDWRDADEQKKICLQRINEINRSLEDERQRQFKRAKTKKIVLLSLLGFVVLAAVFVTLLITVIIPNKKYNDAIALMDAGNIVEAATTFEALGNYKDSADRANECQYNVAVALIDDGRYNEAAAAFEKLGDYKDSADYLSKFIHFYNKITEVESRDGGIYKRLKTYDSNGNLTKEVYTGSDGNIRTTEYTYDSNGNLTKKVETDDGDIRTTEYTYDSKGNLTKKVDTGSDGNISTIEYTYDSKGNKAKEVYTDSDGKIRTREYTYDSNGNPAKLVDTDSNGQISTDEITCDSKGNVIKEAITHENPVDSDRDVLYESTEYTYDSNGNLTKEVYTDFSGTSHTTEYTYDSKGNKAKEVYTDSDGNIYGTTEYTYDSKGNLIKEVYTYAEDSDWNGTKEYTYEDEHVIYKP